MQTPDSSTVNALGLLVLRAVPSGLMMTHGWPKLGRLLDQWGSEEGVKFFDFLGLGPEVSLILTVLAELVAPALVAMGWKTRWAALPAAFTMTWPRLWCMAATRWGTKNWPCCTSCASPP